MASKVQSYRFDKKTIDLISRIKSKGDFKSFGDAVAAALEFYEAENMVDNLRLRIRNKSNIKIRSKQQRKH